jgi:hypothetical protein
MKRLLITTDLGTFKAYELEDDRFSTSPHFQMVDAFEMEAGHDRLIEKVSDKEGGKFGRGSAGGAFNEGGNGERHNINLEHHKRGMKQIAERMKDLLRDNIYETCLFAAPAEINGQILDLLPREIRVKIEKTIPNNLVNAPRNELLRQFTSNKIPAGKE